MDYPKQLAAQAADDAFQAALVARYGAKAGTMRYCTAALPAPIKTLAEAYQAAADEARIERLSIRHAALIAECKRELAMNFDCPAKRIIGVYCAKMNISLQEWEQIAALGCSRYAE
jgi:hypothetical protein